MKPVAPKYRTTAFLGSAFALLVFDLAFVGLRHTAPRPATTSMSPPAADELIAQTDAVDASLPRLQERLKGQGGVATRMLVVEYSAAAAQGAEPTMEMSQLLAEGLAVVTVGTRQPVVLLGDRQVRVGDVLPDGSKVSAIDRHGLATQSAHGASGRLQGFGAISIPASGAASSPAGDNTSNVEGSQ